MKKTSGTHKGILGFLWKLTKEFGHGAWEFFYKEILPTIIAWVIVVVPLILLIVFVPKPTLILLAKIGLGIFFGIIALLLLLCAGLWIYDSWKEYNEE